MVSLSEPTADQGLVSISSRCSENEPALLPRTQRAAEIEPNQALVSRSIKVLLN